jgi:hypothetical protein
LLAQRLARRLAEQEQPAAIARGDAGAHDGAYRNEVGVGLGRVAGEVGPLVRQREWPLRPGQIGIEQRLERHRRGEAVDTGDAEIRREQRQLRASRRARPGTPVSPLHLVQRRRQGLGNIAGTRESSGVRRGVIGIGAGHGPNQQRGDFAGRRPARRQRQADVKGRPRVVEAPDQLEPEHRAGRREQRAGGRGGEWPPRPGGTPCPHGPPPDHDEDAGEGAARDVEDRERQDVRGAGERRLQCGIQATGVHAVSDRGRGLGKRRRQRRDADRRRPRTRRFAWQPSAGCGHRR